MLCLRVMLSLIFLSISHAIITLVGIAVFLVTSRADSTVPPVPLNVSMIVIVVSFDSSARISRAVMVRCLYSRASGSHTSFTFGVVRRGVIRRGGVAAGASGDVGALWLAVGSVGSAADIVLRFLMSSNASSRFPFSPSRFTTSVIIEARSSISLGANRARPARIIRWRMLSRYSPSVSARVSFSDQLFAFRCIFSTLSKLPPTQSMYRKRGSKFT